MARRPNKYHRPVRPLRLAGEASASKSDGRWITRPVRAENALKTYTCPECQRPIPPGTAHLVAWPHTPPIGSLSGLDHRRHYHRSCWERRR